jgi:hypothetical protein
MFQRERERESLSSYTHTCAYANDLGEISLIPNLVSCQKMEGQLVKLGGLDLSLSCLDRESRYRHFQKVSLGSRENLDTSKKLVSTVKIF